jgi:hypothetical protein
MADVVSMVAAINAAAKNLNGVIEYLLLGFSKCEEVSLRPSSTVLL